MKKEFKIEVSNGLYIGDLCYALSNKVYDKVWGANDYKDGSYVEPDSKLQFAMVGTAYGDGCYEGSDGVDYPVDAGIIGICDMGLVEKNITGLGRIIANVEGEVFIKYDNGDIIITWNNGNKEVLIKTDC